MKRILLLITCLCFAQAVFSHPVEVYHKLPYGIAAVASSSHGGYNPAHAVDGSGMKGEKHVSNNQGHGMWLSDISKKPVRYSRQTQEGTAWFLCEIGGKDDPAVRIDQMRIWNYNQNEHTRRGIRRAYIEYSADGKEWKLLKDGENDWHVIPESVGKNPEPADYVLDTPGMKAKFILITAIDNYYDKSNPVIVQEMRDMHQRPDYYGFSELCLYNKVKVDSDDLKPVSRIALDASQGYLRTSDGPSREYYLTFDEPLHTGATLEFEMNGDKWIETISQSAKGISEYTGCFPAGYMEEAERLTVRMESRQGNPSLVAEIPAARKWEVCFFPHSHLDIGYTHRQKDVMKLQWRNFERAMDLAERTEDYPDGAKYRWNTEATWAVTGYLEEYAGTAQADRLLEAIKDGIVNVDATLGSILTGISRQEELMHMCDDAHRISELTGVEINTAMMSDVPGQVWGMATALAKNGVRYYSPGPNYVPFYGKIGNDRAAALHTEWGDRPFWWESQSGTDRVMVWQAGRGYSWFHGWLAGTLSVCGPEPIWKYLEELETDEFPYHTCYLRYTVHGDNGPPDQEMPDVIKAWNEKYESPKFKIGTTREFFEAFEKEYGADLPVYKGDMTPTWEDGAASTARETAMNRNSSARLAQSGILWSMLSDEAFPAAEFDEAWKNVLLFSEHTWGASASGPDPHSKFTKDLWEGKKMYADSADVQSRRLEARALSSLNNGGFVQVLNTNLWTRTDVVALDADLEGKRLVDADGGEVAAQRMSDGRWIFIAEDVPALSSAVYRIETLKKKSSDKAFASFLTGKNVLDNGVVKVVVNPETGTITSLKLDGSDFEYVGGEGLNDYLYSGRRGSDPRKSGAVKSMELIDDGPLAATLRIVSEAPGCNSLWRDITIYKGMSRVDILNTLDKQDIIDFEDVRFIFPFNFPHPDITMDLAMSEIHPEREQLAGVNKHYWSLLNGYSVGDLEHGICVTSLDAPFIELGTPSGEDYRKNPRHGYGWWPAAQISPVIYSWVMTNTWRTNYKASQGGIATFRYSLQPGDPFDLKLKQRGLEREQEMIAVCSDRSEPVEQLFRLTGRHRISVSDITPSADGKGYIVRLQNMGKHAVRSSFVWGAIKGAEAYECDHTEQYAKPFSPADFWMQPFEYKIIKITVD